MIAAECFPQFLKTATCAKCGAVESLVLPSLGDACAVDPQWHLSRLSPHVLLDYRNLHKIEVIP